MKGWYVAVRTMLRPRKQGCEEEVRIEVYGMEMTEIVVSIVRRPSL